MEQARQIVDGLLATLSHFQDWRLPELFAGYGCAEAPLPVAYPTPCQPQAWVTGGIFLLVFTMLGLEPALPGQARRGAPFLPSGTERLHVKEIWVPQGRVDIEVTRLATGTVPCASDLRASEARRPDAA